MICPRKFVEALRERGIRLVTGVPCSYLTGLINTAIDHPAVEYVGAANEGEAVAIACGAELGGQPAAVMFQNSGFGNAVSPLTSLTAIFRIPVLILATWRGQPDGPADEPQHALMGQITPELFDLIGIRRRLLPEHEADVAAVLDEAFEFMRSERLPFGLIVRDGIFEKRALETHAVVRDVCADGAVQSPADMPHHEQDDVLRAVAAALPDRDVLIATTGYTGRALYALGDRPNQLCMVGSMGCASSLGLGLAKAQPQRRIVVLDGDGAFLMRMGAVAVVGHERPTNLLHIVLDNGVHDSTGGQATVSQSIDVAGIARACGYPRVIRAGRLDEIADELRRPCEALTFLHVKTTPRRNRKLPRPTITPTEVAQRLRHWLQEA